MVLQHIPLRIRHNARADAVFLSEWQQENASDPNLLAQILDRPKASQRDAQVAASLMCWLGSGVGYRWLLEAKRMAKDHPDYVKTDAYLMAWAIVNKRQAPSVRMVEFILACEVDWEVQHGHPTVRRDSVQISLRDLDVIEAVIVWLAGDEGALFMANCDKLAGM